MKPVHSDADHSRHNLSMQDIKARTRAVALSLLHASQTDDTAVASSAWAARVGLIKRNEDVYLAHQIQYFLEQYPAIIQTLRDAAALSAQITAWQRADAAVQSDLHLLFDDMSAELEQLHLPTPAAADPPVLNPGGSAEEPAVSPTHGDAHNDAAAAANANNKAVGAAGDADVMELLEEDLVMQPMAEVEDDLLIAPQPPQPVAAPQPDVPHVAAAAASAHADDSMPDSAGFKVGQAVIVTGNCKEARSNKWYCPGVGAQGHITAIEQMQSATDSCKVYHVKIVGGLELACHVNDIIRSNSGKRTRRSGN
jgi:hypothetical protein